MNLFPATCFTNIITPPLTFQSTCAYSPRPLPVLCEDNGHTSLRYHFPQPDVHRYLSIVFVLSVRSLTILFSVFIYCGS